MTHKVTESWEGKLELVDTWKGERWQIDEHCNVIEILQQYNGKKIKLTIEEVKE